MNPSSIPGHHRSPGKHGMHPKVAALTMVYNERAYLQIWARHYARQVGADHCYVIDHGSTESLLFPPGVNVIRLPRSPHDDWRRALFISSFVEGLLEYFDWVIHTDVDELVIPDPNFHANLPIFCSSTAVDTVTTIGFDIQHLPDSESVLKPELPVGPQRRWMRFTSAMCKPVLTRRPLIWSPGFHCADTPVAFSTLYLFHLRWVDWQIGMTRLAKTRIMPWANQEFGAHQRISDREWAELFTAMAGFERITLPVAPDIEPLSTWLARTISSTVGREGDVYKLDLHINATELVEIPTRFRERL